MERKAARYVLASEPEPGVGLLKVTMFPGLVGVDMAAAIDQAISSLASVERLIVDLRGNPGGGSANLRLMSYFTPQKIPVGYSLTRPRAQAGYRREDLPQFRRIPSNKLALIWLALRFKWVDKSIVVVTEGLSRQRFQGKIVLLVNEHTTSGAEIVAGFAHENRLATIVGSRTAGRLLGWASLPMGHGFRLTIPVSNYITWEGRCFENSGVEPDIAEPFQPELALTGRDNQLEAAVRVARSL
jgi:C-terminal processing protease CtpA/Prc